jgi:hypothetical protein
MTLRFFLHIWVVLCLLFTQRAALAYAYAPESSDSVAVTTCLHQSLSKESEQEDSNFDSDSFAFVDQDNGLLFSVFFLGIAEGRGAQALPPSASMYTGAVSSYFSRAPPLLDFFNLLVV